MNDWRGNRQLEAVSSGPSWSSYRMSKQATSHNIRAFYGFLSHVDRQFKRGGGHRGAQNWHMCLKLLENDDMLIHTR